MATPEDWRLQLLKEEGISSDDGALKTLLGGGKATENQFVEWVPKLGAEDFATRQQAEKAILRMGKAALPWLDRMPLSDNPEIRFRLARIGKELGLEREWTKDDLQLMSIAARRFENGDVELNVALSPRSGAPRFTTKTRVDAGVIGKLRSISLDRSGRGGGDGYFDNLVIRLAGK